MVYKFDQASVLVVDDMPPMVTLTKSLLEIFGFRKIYTANNAERAFEIFCKESPDLVLTDWQMEPYDGIELTHQIRTDSRSPNPYVPIILMTGYSAKMRVMQARDIGVTEFLVKPFTSQDLYARIEQVIEKPRQFVDADGFFGPDRRRRIVKDYEGPFRREDDTGAGDDVVKGPQQEKAQRDLAKILSDLKKDRSKD